VKIQEQRYKIFLACTAQHSTLSNLSPASSKAALQTLLHHLNQRWSRSRSRVWPEFAF